MKVCTIIGARPQFIKSAAVSRAFLEQNSINEVIIHTGQHFDANMSDIFFNELNIPKPLYNLGISSMGHGAMTGRMMESLEQAFQTEMPDWVLVFGDTNSTIAGALAASKLHIPVAHVEAGLRSFNFKMPEEINRILTDHCSDQLFTPTKIATENLKNEGIFGDRVTEVGDVMQDAAVMFGELAASKSSIVSELGLIPKNYILATIHRQENTEDMGRLAAILGGLGVAAQTMDVVLPLHPRTRAKLNQADIQINHKIKLVDPIGFLDMLSLEKIAAVIATDSGGVQKEAYFHRVPCVTLRDETEWTELVAAGWNVLCPPTSTKEVSDAIHAAMGTKGQEIALYGDGNASKRIVERLGCHS